MKYETPKNSAQLGVEINELNISETFSNEEIKKIRQVWLDYGVAVFPNQKLSHEQFEKFSLLFGNFGNDPYLKSLDERPNIVEVKRSAKEKSPPFGGSWHSDWSFQKNPPSATLLHSKIIPPVGGDTLFANTQLAYEDLDDEMKKKINNLKVIGWKNTWFAMSTLRKTMCTFTRSGRPSGNPYTCNRWGGLFTTSAHLTRTFWRLSVTTFWNPEIQKRLKSAPNSARVNRYPQSVPLWQCSTIPATKSSENASVPVTIHLNYGDNCNARHNRP